MESGGDIFLKFEYVNEIKNFLKKKNISEKERKECHDGIRRVESSGEIMKLMIKKALLEEKVSCRIREFSVFLEGAVNKCFQSIRPIAQPNKNNSKMLEVYSGSKNFKFEISGEEYANVLRKSGGKIEIPNFIFLSEFMSCVTDKSILESEIIPSYLKINAIKEIDGRKEIVIEDFYNWWISVG